MYTFTLCVLSPFVTHTCTLFVHVHKFQLQFLNIRKTVLKLLYNKRSVATALKADMVLLQEKFLQDLVTMKLISEHTKKRCLEVQKTWLQQNTLLVVHANFSTLGYKDRMMYFSVYSGVVKYYSKLLRVRVTFDSEIGVWSCKCPLSGERSSCVHEVMSKWYVFQKDKDRMLSSQSRQLSFQLNFFFYCIKVLCLWRYTLLCLWHWRVMKSNVPHILVFAKVVSQWTPSE